jgi:hypothetical protein
VLPGVDHYNLVENLTTSKHIITKEIIAVAKAEKGGRCHKCE